MVLPWKSTMSEIRLTDVPYKNDVDFINNYMKPYEEVSGRFIDIQQTFSHEVRLTFDSKANICAYLLNYIRRDRTYSEMTRNCQTFAADFCGFLSGTKNIRPFHPINKLEYVNRYHYFLYESEKYSSKKKKRKKTKRGTQ